MSSIEVSAVIPAYERPGPLRDAVASVLAQELEVGEVVVVDDGSTADLEAAVAMLDDRVRVVRHATNRGAPAARNTGVGAARGRLIAFLDSDDAWTPGKLSCQVPVMADGVESSVTGFTHRRDDRDETVLPAASGITFERMLRGCHVAPGTTWMVRKARFEALGGFDETMLRLEDWDLLLRDCRDAPIGSISRSCAIVNAHAGPRREVVEASLAHIRHRWMPSLSPSHRRLLRAGLLMESAAAAYRDADLRGTVARTLAASALDPWQAAETVRRTRRRRVAEAT